MGVETTTVDSQTDRQKNADENITSRSAKVITYYKTAINPCSSLRQGSASAVIGFGFTPFYIRPSSYLRDTPTSDVYGLYGRCTASLELRLFMIRIQCTLLRAEKASCRENSCWNFTEKNSSLCFQIARNALPFAPTREVIHCCQADIVVENVSHSELRDSELTLLQAEDRRTYSDCCCFRTWCGSFTPPTKHNCLVGVGGVNWTGDKTKQFCLVSKFGVNWVLSCL